MNQRASWSMFVGGLATFITSLGEFFSTHNSWQEMQTPTEVGHMFIMFGSLLFALGGALGINLHSKKDK